ncbi:hypothetical protein [Komagataeibacter sp. NFXK3]
MPVPITFDLLEKLSCKLLTAASRTGLLQEGCEPEETGQVLATLCLGGPHQQMLFGRRILTMAKEHDDYLGSGLIL